MRVCLVSPEAFAWGVHGGFGYVTRTLARELSRRGVEVSIVTKRRPGQGEVEELDGATVYGYSEGHAAPNAVNALFSRCSSLRCYRAVDANVYHSQEASYGTIAALLAAPKRRHVITFQDPYDSAEWNRIAKVEPRYAQTPTFRARLTMEVELLTEACRRVDAIYTQARFLIPRARRLYHLKKDPDFLPNPVYPVSGRVRKSPKPMLCFLARWDPQKRVERFLDLSRRFPNVEFVAMGRAHDLRRDAEIRGRYRDVTNLSMQGFVSEEEKGRILSESWALINTSVREALPVSFLEALAHETPIISGEDPDGLTSTYGYPVTGDDYTGAVARMLASDEWMEKGKRGRRLVEEVYAVDKVVEKHIEAYQRLVGDIG
jgi:glycosyltransferase involved in cell wall biosynthesis